jgi:hypothetical protein
LSAALVDIRGCLTEAGFRALERAAIGKAPPELAVHLAGCPRCQERMLSGRRAPGEPPHGERKQPPPAWRLWALVGLMLLVLVLFAATLQWLSHR